MGWHLVRHRTREPVDVLPAFAGYAHTLGGMRHPLKPAMPAVGIAVTVVVCRIIMQRVRTVLNDAQARLGRR